MGMIRLVMLSAALAIATSAHAQWLNHPTPGVPRLASGSIDLAAPVPPELMAKYMGVYELERPAGFGIRTIEITRDGNQLWVALNGRGRLPMTPLSDACSRHVSSAPTSS